MTTLARSAFHVGFFTLISRMLGYVRDVFIAMFFGAGVLSDAFFVAFRLPNFFRQLTAEGAFNAAFIPMLSGIYVEKGQKEAEKFASQVLSFMMATLLIFVVLVEIAMPWVMYGLAPGFVGKEKAFDYVVTFGRIMFPYLLFISLVALIGGVFNSMNRFIFGSSAPILLNLCMVISLFVLKPYMPSAAHALSVGVCIAGVVQCLWMICGLRSTTSFQLSFGRISMNRNLKTLLKRMVPGIIAGGVTQINLWINTILATLLASGSISYLYYADRLSQFPLSIIGTALGTALLPTLSKQLQQKKYVDAYRTQNYALETALLLTLPAAMGLVVLAKPILSLLFAHGEFVHEDTIGTAKALMVYGFGLPAFVMVKIFTPCFFAAHDTKTPVKIAMVCVSLNLCLNLLLMKPLGYVGLALSTVVVSWINTGLLALCLMRCNLFKFQASSIHQICKVVCVVMMMGVCVCGLQLVFPFDFHMSTLLKLVYIFLYIGGAGIVYCAGVFALKIVHMQQLKDLLRHGFKEQ